MDNGKQCYLEMLERVREKRSALGAVSQVGEALSDNVLRTVHQKIENTNRRDLLYSYWPPVLGLVDSREISVLAQLDRDIELVLANSPKPGQKLAVTQFMRTGAGEKHGHWYGGFFDLW